MTESYSSSQDPPEKAIPVCTLKNFPSAPEHTIQWALDLFQGLFKNGPDVILQYLEAGSFSIFKERISGGISSSPSRSEAVDVLIDVLFTNPPADFEACISWAYRLFLTCFHDTIAQLLYNFPSDAKTSSGADFWTGPKRCPDPIRFSIKNDLHREFIIAAARLRAVSYSLSIPKEFLNWDNEKWDDIISSIHIDPFVPKNGISIKLNEENNNSEPSSTIKDSNLERQAENENLLATLSEEKQNKLQLSPNPLEFEKVFSSF